MAAILLIPLTLSHRKVNFLFSASKITTLHLQGFHLYFSSMLLEQFEVEFTIFETKSTAKNVLITWK